MIELKPGDIILYKGTKALSKSIQFFMERYRKKLGLEKRTLFNHAAMVVDLWGQTYVAEANEKGIEVNPFTNVYGSKLKRIKVLRPKKGYSKAEQELVSKTAIAYSLNPTRYDFFGIWYQIQMIRKQTANAGKEWDGPTGSKAENRLYCTEAVATWANKVRPDTFEKAWSINPLDIDLNKYYETVYDGTK